MGGDCCDHVVPSHVQVSPPALPAASVPPKSTTFPRTSSKSIAWEARAEGDVVGSGRVQLVPSQSHVSARGAPLCDPPKSTVRARTRSYAMASDTRALGEAAGIDCAHDVPFHSHVSPKAVNTMPPNITTRLRRLSNATPGARRHGGPATGAKVQRVPSQCVTVVTSSALPPVSKIPVPSKTRRLSERAVGNGIRSRRVAT